MARPSPNGDRAVVPYQPDITSDGGSYTAADAHKFKHANPSPRELIFHESIAHLVAEVAELRSRCERLEGANEQMTKSMQSLERAFYDQQQHLVRAPLTKANLTGYASSEDSADGADTADIHHATNDQRFDAVAAILEDYHKRIETQAAEQTKMGRQMAELVAYKRNSDMLFRALKSELDGLEPSVAVPSNVDVFGQQQASEIVTVFVDKHERLEGRFNVLDFDLHARIEDIEGRLQSTAEAIQADVTGSNAGTTMCEEVPQTRVTLDKIKAFCKTTMKQNQQEQIIDDANTKEALYRMFADIDSILISDGQRRRCGRFEGNYDELWHLKDRVICRIALFDSYAGAFDEAKRAVARGLD